MDLCFICCSDEVDEGIAPFDRIAAHIGLSDDDLLDFESDNADTPSLANVVRRDKRQPTKLRNHVSSEGYRLERSARRSREENLALQSRKGSEVSRNSGGGDFRRSGSSRRSIQNTHSSELPPAEQPIRRKSGSRSFEGRKSVSGSHSPPQEPELRRSSSKLRQQASEHSPQLAQPAVTRSTLTPPERSTTQRRGSVFRRLSDMSPEEKAQEKRRLQALVKEFAREAVGGFDLILFDMDRGHSASATFSMDRHLLDVKIDSRDESKVRSAHFRVASLTGVFKAEDFYGGSNIQPASSLDLATALVLTTKESEYPKVLVAFSRRQDRDKAYTCLKILRLSVDLAKK